MLFHIYTVDEHTLFVMRNLRRFSLEEHSDELPVCNTVFLLIAKPELLYITALFHDIAKGPKSRQALHFPIHTSIKFLPDPLNRHTVIELITTDHAGLLSKIGRAFIQQNVNLLSAKITTIGSRAEDMFYITDQQLQPITDTGKQNLIRGEMLKMLDSD